MSHHLVCPRMWHWHRRRAAAYAALCATCPHIAPPSRRASGATTISSAWVWFGSGGKYISHLGIVIFDRVGSVFNTSCVLVPWVQRWHLMSQYRAWCVRHCLPPSPCVFTSTPLHAERRVVTLISSGWGSVSRRVRKRKLRTVGFVFTFSAGSEHCLAPRLDEATEADDDARIGATYSAPRVLRSWPGREERVDWDIRCVCRSNRLLHSSCLPCFPAWLQQTRVNSATWAHSLCKNPAGRRSHQPRHRRADHRRRRPVQQMLPAHLPRALPQPPQGHVLGARQRAPCAPRRRRLARTPAATRGRFPARV
jgi:hypothetical protein